MTAYASKKKQVDAFRRILVLLNVDQFTKVTKCGTGWKIENPIDQSRYGQAYYEAHTGNI